MDDKEDKEGSDSTCSTSTTPSKKRPRIVFDLYAPEEQNETEKKKNRPSILERIQKIKPPSKNVSLQVLERRQVWLFFL